MSVSKAHMVSMVRNDMNLGARGVALDKLTTESTSFNPDNSQHMELIRGILDDFRMRLTHLKQVDARLLKGALVCLAGLALWALIPSIWPIAIGAIMVGIGLAGMAWGGRQYVKPKYDYALNSMVAACKWTLSDGGTANRNAEQAVVKSIVQELNALMEEDTLKSLVHESARASVQMKPVIRTLAGDSLFKQGIQREKASLTSALYGYGKGDFRAVFSAARKALWTVCRDGLSSLRGSVQSMNSSASKEDVDRDVASLRL